MTSANVHAVLTPPGAGGIAVLAATGPGVLDVVTRIFRPGRLAKGGVPASLPQFRSGKLYYGHVLDADRPLDEVILAVLLPPDSSTGSPYVEINCHGGTVPVRAVSELLVRFGVSLIDPDDFMKLSLGASCDHIQYEAELLALEAVTLLAARHLFHQASGALSEALRTCLADIASGPEGCERARRRFLDLLATAPFGIGLAQPRTITVVGLPNVGKSTLANMLVGSDRSLVHHLPGTTRDAVSSLGALAGVPVRVVDTAGLRETLDTIEAAGVRISLDRLRSADLVLWVFDHSRPLDTIESAHLELLRGKPVICVVNKMDLPGSLPDIFLSEPFGAAPVRVSALSGAGRAELERRIVAELFGPRLPEVGEPLVFTARLRDILETASHDPVGAVSAISGLLQPVAPGSEA